MCVMILLHSWRRAAFQPYIGGSRWLSWPPGSRLFLGVVCVPGLLCAGYRLLGPGRGTLRSWVLAAWRLSGAS